MLAQLAKLILAPARAVGRLFRRAGRGAGETGRAAVKTGAGAAARLSGDELLATEFQEETPSGFETLLFRQLPRPRLVERAAAELTLEQAEEYAQQARGFYRYSFPLFARGDFFYEEVEEDYIAAALGFDDQTIDRRFLELAQHFRRTLNGNTRRMLTYWPAAIYAACFTSAAALALAGGVDFSRFAVAGAPGAVAAPALASVVASALAFLVYSWPFKVVQQRNLMNFDNYVTSKFARINNNFQVAKRRALNVERDKRIPQRDELKDEAGAWTLAYHWFAMRLFLCELALRNKFYQMRRNTVLYWFGGMTLLGAAAAALEAGLWRAGAEGPLLAAFAGGSAAYLVISASIMRRASAMMFRVVESNEWSRFGRIDLDETIKDHVGEDKLQIVTFRDRNRME